MVPPDPTKPYHLSTDGSGLGVGAVLFQLAGTISDKEVKEEDTPNIRIIIFISFQLNNYETRYSNPEKECLAVVKALAETKWLI